MVNSVIYEVIYEVFDLAREENAIIFVDKFETIYGSNGGVGERGYRLSKWMNMLLDKMDESMAFVAASNNIWALANSNTNRFQKVYMLVPTASEAATFLVRKFEGMNDTVQPDDLPRTGAKIAKQGLCLRELQRLVLRVKTTLVDEAESSEYHHLIPFRCLNGNVIDVWAACRADDPGACKEIPDGATTCPRAISAYKIAELVVPTRADLSRGKRRSYDNEARVVCTDY